MLSKARSPLGAPGVFALPDVPVPALSPQRLDVCAFVGVAPRGPAWQPVVDQDWPAGYAMVTDAERPLKRSVAVFVRSFDEYQRLFGGFEGPGLLPHAVASYFEQGGRRAWIVRVAHARSPAQFGEHCASGSVSGAFTAPIAFVARNEGVWGNRLRVSLAFTATAASFTLDGANIEVDAASPLLVVGSTLRFTDALGNRSLARVTDLQRIRDAERARERWRLSFDLAPPNPLRAELIQARIDIDDGAGQRESFAQLALAADHPDSLANVLCERSTLLWPHPDWAATTLLPADTEVEFLNATSAPFTQGIDAWEDLLSDDFFDPHWAPADETPGDGICALAQIDSVTQVVLPDLYQPAQWAEDTTVIAGSGGSGPEFGPCVDIVAPASAVNTPPSALTGLILDPRTNAGLTAITALQQRVVEFCESTQNHIALIDVPPGLSQGRIEQWRAAFDTAWVAAYHPWLIPARSNADLETGAIRRRQLPPSAVAAGIVARRETQRGIQFGPANEIAKEIVHFAEAQPEGRADALHPQSINCFVRQPDGIGLIAARTLSREREWRQLSVRRLMLMLRRTLLIETQWAVFEPNGPALWQDLQHAIESLLRGLFRAGAFAGRTEAQSFFVRVLNDRTLLDRGELVVDIGVAPAEPLEFILVRLRRDGDGTLTLEE
jgi:hypothetical protein